MVSGTEMGAPRSQASAWAGARSLSGVSGASTNIAAFGRRSRFRNEEEIITLLLRESCPIWTKAAHWKPFQICAERKSSIKTVSGILVGKYTSANTHVTEANLTTNAGAEALALNAGLIFFGNKYGDFSLKPIDQSPPRTNLDLY